jgi:serine/threonine-protein kinase
MGTNQVMTLADIIRHGHMETRHKVRLWIDILRAIAERHRSGVVYGSLNPQSILIDMRNNIVPLEAPPDPDSPYTAPELKLGVAPDEQADIYSMGVMLFELLTGSLRELHHYPPSRMVGDVPRWIDPIVLRCIMKKRSQRYLDLDEIAQEFQRLKSFLELG